MMNIHVYIYPYILLHGIEITEMLYSFDFVLEM